MIHDITINSDFAKNRRSHFTIDLFSSHINNINNFNKRFLENCNDYDRKNGNDLFDSKREENETVLTGTALQRLYKRQYLEDGNNCCHCCGGAIDIKLWNLKSADNKSSLCSKCDTRLDDEFNVIPTMVIKPWNNLNDTVEDIKDKVEHERRIKDLFLWD